MPISGIEKIELGGIDQYIITGGIDSTKPVLLFLHGGPGSPEMGFVKKFNPELEHDFVVVHWELRGSGKSYNNNISIESMTIEQFISDTQELSEYLIKRINKDKIYIMGSYPGIKTIEKHPELFHCYFGIGQVADQYRSEKISFEWVIFQGVYDYQTSFIVAKEFYDQLKAPEKQFVTFENSAHCPIFDEPDRFNKILREILTKEYRTTIEWDALLDLIDTVQK